MNSKTVGAGLGIAVLVGIFLSGYLPKFGGGLGLGLGGGGGGDGTAPQAAPIATGPEAPAAPEKVAEKPAEEPEKVAEVVETTRVVHVLVDGREYFVEQFRDDKPHWQPASLTEITALAAAATGDEDGIRVRISRKGSARATAEMALSEALLKAGLPEEAIRREEGLRP